MWLNVRNSVGSVDGRALEPGELMIGRDVASGGLALIDERASRYHARLTAWPDGQVQVEDLGSTNGTWVNGSRIAGPTLLRVGDEIRVGAHVISLSDHSDGPAPAPPPPPPPYQAPAAPGPWMAPSAWVGAAPAAPAGLGGSPATPFPPSAPSTPTKRRKGRWIAGGVGALAVIAVIVVLLVTQLRGGGTLSPGQVSADWSPSTLYLLVSDQGQPQDSGTAWVYNASEGLIVTNAHVVDGGTTFVVGQGAKKQKASLVAVDPCEDLAMLRITDTRGLHSFHLGSQATTHGGDQVTALGYPAGSTQTPSLATTTGVVSVVSTHFDQAGSVETPAYPDVVETTAPINPGNSGGPLLNDKGQLIGVNTAGLDQDQNGQTLQNEGFAIGVDRVRTDLVGLSQGRSIGYNGMDLYFPTDPSTDFANFNVPEVDNGVIVPDAQPGSPAARAGFGQGGNASVITAINGHNLDGSLVSYCNAIGGKVAGQSASFSVVLSNGGQANVTVPFE